MQDSKIHKASSTYIPMTRLDVLNTDLRTSRDLAYSWICPNEESDTRIDDYYDANFKGRPEKRNEDGWILKECINQAMLDELIAGETLHLREHVLPVGIPYVTVHDAQGQLVHTVAGMRPNGQFPMLADEHSSSAYDWEGKPWLTLANGWQLMSVSCGCDSAQSIFYRPETVTTTCMRRVYKSGSHNIRVDCSVEVSAEEGHIMVGFQLRYDAAHRISDQQYEKQVVEVQFRPQDPSLNMLQIFSLLGGREFAEDSIGITFDAEGFLSHVHAHSFYQQENERWESNPLLSKIRSHNGRQHVCRYRQRMPRLPAERIGDVLERELAVQIAQGTKRLARKEGDSLVEYVLGSRIERIDWNKTIHLIADLCHRQDHLPLADFVRQAAA